MKKVSVININKTQAKYFEKRQHQNKNQRVSDSKNPWYCRTSPWFCRAHSKPLNVPSVCELDQLLSGVLQILKKRTMPLEKIIEFFFGKKRQSFNPRKLSYGA